MSRANVLLLAGVVLGVTSRAALGYSALPSEAFGDLRFRQNIGASLPLDAPFRNAVGASVRLGDFFAGKPVVLVLEYLHCKTLCGFVLQDAAEALSHMPLTAGRDYQVLAISIDPREGPEDARSARSKYLARFDPSDAAGWHFLTGAETAIRAVANAAGFPLRYDGAIDQYAHPAGLVVATPQGRIARYLLGVDYRPLDLRLALSEAAEGSLSSPASELLLLCYGYDPGTGRYSFAIWSATRALCLATVLGLATLIAALSRRKRS